MLMKETEYPNCEDCDCELDHTRIVHNKRLIKPYTHWSKQCQSCKAYQSPSTGEFNLTNTELRHEHFERAGKTVPFSPPKAPFERVIHQQASTYKKNTGRPVGAKNKPKLIGPVQPKPMGRPKGTKNKRVYV